MIANRALHVQERQARFTLFVFIVTLVDYAIMASVLRFPWEPSLPILSLYALAAFSIHIGRAERRQGKVIMDERDWKINKVAAGLGFRSFYGYLFLIWIVWCLVLGPKGVVTVEVWRLGFMLFAGMIIVFTVGALATLVMYWRDAHGEAN
jgi:hypothetical protein